MAGIGVSTVWAGEVSVCTVFEEGNASNGGVTGSRSGVVSTAWSRMYFVLPRRLPGAMRTVKTCLVSSKSFTIGGNTMDPDLGRSSGPPSRVTVVNLPVG